MSSERDINIRPMKLQDLELVIAWRSNPLVYRHFKEQEESFEWEEHLQWFSSRPEKRRDFIIEYKGRRVGSVCIDENDFAGIYIGEIKAQEKSIGSYALRWLCDKFSERELKAEINEENRASRKLFEKCGFEEERREGGWITYMRR